MEEYLSEKEQWEWVKSQVRENAASVALAVAVVIVAVAGWRWWQARNDAGRVAASETYAQMVKSLEHGDRGQALAALGVLERDYSSTPYADQGRLLAARVHVEGGELDRAAAELNTVIQGSKDRDLALVARGRLARVQIAQGKADAALATLDGAGKDAGAFAATWHEIRGDALLARSDRAGALKEYRLAQAAGAEQPSDALALKIADLAGDAPAPVTVSLQAPGAAAGNEGR